MKHFKLNDTVDKNKVFLVNFSEIEGRLDAGYYAEHFDFSNCIKLKTIAKVKGGKRIPKGLSYAEKETDFIYLRVSDLDSTDNINWEKAKYISKNIYKKLERYETVEGDLIFSIAGSVGKINIVKNIPLGKKVILTENAAKINFKDKQKTKSEFIEILLKTNFLQRQISLNY